MILETLVVFGLGLLPPLFSLFLLRQMEVRAQARLRAAIARSAVSAMPAMTLPPDCRYVDGVGYLIGDISCRFNARSTHIRCAVNPSGPCQQCSHYEPIEFA